MNDSDIDIFQEFYYEFDDIMISIVIMESIAYLVLLVIIRREKIKIFLTFNFN